MDVPEMEDTNQNFSSRIDFFLYLLFVVECAQKNSEIAPRLLQVMMLLHFYYSMATQFDKAGTCLAIGHAIVCNNPNRIPSSLVHRLYCGLAGAGVSLKQKEHWLDMADSIPEAEIPYYNYTGLLLYSVGWLVLNPNHTLTNNYRPFYIRLLNAMDKISDKELPTNYLPITSINDRDLILSGLKAFLLDRIGQYSQAQYWAECCIDFATKKKPGAVIGIGIPLAVQLAAQIWKEIPERLKDYCARLEDSYASKYPIIRAFSPMVSHLISASREKGGQIESSMVPELTSWDTALLNSFDFTLQELLGTDME